MSRLDAALIAAGIKGLNDKRALDQNAKKYIIDRTLEKSGAQFNKDTQCWERNGRSLTIESALFGGVESLERFLED